MPYSSVSVAASRFSALPLNFCNNRHEADLDLAQIYLTTNYEIKVMGYILFHIKKQKIEVGTWVAGIARFSFL